MPTDPKAIERWVWILVYAGLLVIALGWFAAHDDEALGTSMIGGGVLAVLAGVALIVLRSRMKP